MTRRKAPEPEPVTATTSAVAALARSAVGATGRSIDNSIELAPGSRFAGLLKSAEVEPVAPRAPAPQSLFATQPASADEQPIVPAFRPAGSAAAVAPLATVPAVTQQASFADAIAAVTIEPPASIERARFVIDPPMPEPELAPLQPAAAVAIPAMPAVPVLAVAAVAPAIEQIAAPIAAFAAPQSAEAPVITIETTAPAAVASTAPVNPITTGPVIIARDDEQLSQLRQEVAGMRHLIEREMNRFTDERLRGSAVRANALDLMDEYGFDAGLARDVATQIPADIDPSRARGLMLGLISKKLPIAPVDPMETGGVIALVGPTGAGKTTTIAKLASRFAEAHAARDVALVTTDTQRIGAREQLYGFGRQLGIAVHEANSGTDLNQLLQKLADYKLVLIDTAGLGQRDRALTAQLQWLRAAGQIRTLLVLPANTAFQDMDEVVRRFSAANPQGVVLTKLDETGRFGSALSVAVDHRLPITWVTDGQDVPEDLYRASAANLVLRLEDLRRAADMPCNTELNNAVA